MDLGLCWGSTTVVAELWLSFSFSFVLLSTSSAQLAPGAKSDFRVGITELSLTGVTGVMAPDATLLDCAEACEDAMPLAACAYENGIAGAELSPREGF